LPARALAAAGSGRPLRDGALAIVLALGVAACLRRHGARAAGLLAAALALALAPVLPVSKAFQPRYAGLAWLAVAVAFAFGCSALARAGRGSRAAALALAALACAAALAVNRGAWAPRLALAERMSAEGRAFLGLNRGDYLRHPSIPPAAMNELRWWKEEGLALRRGGGWFADDLYLCAHGGSVARLYEYAEEGRGVVETTAELPELRAGYCGGLRDEPLAADFSYSGGDFSWQLGPYAAGKWAIVYRDGVERYDVAPHDGYRHHASVFTLRIRYESPEGWVTYSPDIPLDFRASPRLRWERHAARAS
jgi:hypothetical protein